MMTHYILQSDFSVFEDAAVLTQCSSDALAVEIVLEQRKYYFWRNFLRMTFDE